MINQKIALSALSIVTALALTGGATYAFFSDTAQSTQNTFATGNADLQVSAADAETTAPVLFQDTLVDAFNVSNIIPGYDQTHFYWLKNNSSSTINLDTTADVSGYSAPNNQDLALASNLLVSWRCDLNNNNSLGDEVYTSEFSVKDWFDGGNATIGTITSGDEMFCEMRTRLPNTVDNTVANGSVDFDVMYNATQL